MKKRIWFWIVFVLLAAILLFWMLGGTGDTDETTPVFTVVLSFQSVNFAWSVESSENVRFADASSSIFA